MKTPFSSESIPQLATADLTYFLESCETILGLTPKDFDKILLEILDHVIENADECSPTREVKRVLLFLRALETFLNSIKID